MYLAGPSASGTNPGYGRRTLRLAAVHQCQFDADGRYTPQDRIYFTDLFATFGMTPAEGAFEAGRTTFRDMAAALVPSLGELANGLDMAVLAHATPDAEPGWPMSVLAEAVPQAGLVLGVSEQGVVAPFTALKLVLGNVHADPVRRAVIWIMDQSARLHAGPVPPHRQAAKDVAVALTLSETGTLGPFVFARQHVCGSEAQVRAALDAGLAEMSETGGPVTLVCGAALRSHVQGHPLVAEIRQATHGQPCTGIWSALASCLPTSARVLLADYDEEFGYVGLCGIGGGA